MNNYAVILRGMEPEDVDLLYNWENDKSLWHLSNTTKPFSRYVLEQYILNSHLDIYEQKQMRLMIDASIDGISYSTVGCIDLFDFDPINKRAGVGLLIDSEFRGKGLAKSALIELLNYVKSILKLHQLYCSIVSNNLKSIKVFEDVGFRKTGTRVQWVYFDNRWKDEFFYQLFL